MKIRKDVICNNGVDEIRCKSQKHAGSIFSFCSIHEFTSTGSISNVTIEISSSIFRGATHYFLAKWGALSHLIAVS